MNLKLTPARVRRLLSAAARTQIVVIGDVMLDQFIWGTVARISPEAPVPVLDFERESFMPGGAANVARNLTALGIATELFGVLGQDAAAGQVLSLLRRCEIGCSGVMAVPGRHTSVKTRLVAHKQQVVRIDRESRESLDEKLTRRLLNRLDPLLSQTSAVVIGDYGKGVVTQALLDQLKRVCRQRGLWLSLDPKPVHHLDLSGTSLITPNRKEAFELAKVPDETRQADPIQDANLIMAAERLLAELHPALLLITLGEQGMLLCQRGQRPIHIQTVAQEVFDVSGAGDTVIAFFTAAISAGASPLEAATLANHAAGIVVGKVGTATVSPAELIENFR